MYGYWLCGGQCMDIGCVEVSVWILVVWSLVYGYWLVEISAYILVDGDKCMYIGWWR